MGKPAGPVYAQRGGGGASLCAAGTEVQGCVALSGGGHGERKEFLLVPRGVVAVGQVPLLSGLQNWREGDQSQPLPRVLSVPVHGVMIKVLFTVQGRISSFLSEKVFWGLSDFTTHCACERKRKVLETQPKGAPRLLGWEKGLDLELGIFRTGLCSLNPGLTCSQETKGHTAEHLVAHS